MRILLIEDDTVLGAAVRDEIAGNGRKYPLFTVEVNIQDGNQCIVIESLRTVVMLNTPAINNFEFETILTTPRATKTS